MFFILTVVCSAFLIQESLACAALPTPLTYKVKMTRMNLRYKYIVAGANITGSYGSRMKQSPEEVRNLLQDDVQLAVNEAVEKMCKQHSIDSNQMATAKSQFKLKPPTTYTVLKCDALTFPGAAHGVSKLAGSTGFGCIADEEMNVVKHCTVEIPVNTDINTANSKLCFAGNGTQADIPDSFRTVNFDMDMSNSFFSTSSQQVQNQFASEIKNNLLMREIIKDGDVILSR